METQPEILEIVRRRFIKCIRPAYLFIWTIILDPVKRMVRRFLRYRSGLGWRLLHWLQSIIYRRRIKEHQRLLVDLVKQHPDDQPVIIIAPSLDWDVQLFQRPQQLAMAFARQGALVFYMQLKQTSTTPVFLELQDRLFLCNTLPLTFDVISEPVVYLLTWNSDYRFRFCKPHLLYDYVDDINVFFGDRQLIAEGHESLLRDADLIVATATRLHERILKQRPDALLCPNGVEYERFFAAHTRDVANIPLDMRSIVMDGKPVIGYYGALARWFDYSLVDQLAALCPDYHFVLIGPDYDGTLHDKPLFQRDNVHWLKVKPYIVLPGYLAYFDVAIIPFIVSEITHATSPLKLFEYMAGGKPVVVTPMEESLRYPGVLVGRDAQEFAVQLEKALALRTDERYMNTIDTVARENTWDMRAQLILCHCRRVLNLP